MSILLLNSCGMEMWKFMVFYFILDSFSIHNSTLSNDFGPKNTEIVKMD